MNHKHKLETDLARFRPTLHSLEARVNPATFVVTTLADDGSAGSLRSLVQLTDTLAGADDLVFDTSLAGTLTLSRAIDVNDTLRFNCHGYANRPVPNPS